MPRVCTICAHSERAAIDDALASGLSIRKIAQTFSVSYDALHRHKKAHLPATLAKATEAADVARADDVLGQVVDLHTRTLALLTKAERSPDIRATSGVIGQARRNLELLGKLTHELQQEGTVNIALQVQDVRLRLVAALEPWPEARLAAARALSE